MGISFIWKTVNTDEKTGVDSAATAGYLGAAYNDGVLKVTQNELTYTDGGNFITLGLADHNTARTALGLAIGTDVAANSHAMSTHSDEDTYNISTSGSATVGSLIGPAAALDINTSLVQDVNFWDTIASGNPSINIYGWNTAGGDRESAELTMDDTNDEFLIQVPNSANNEGVTVSLLETNQQFRVRQNSDWFGIRCDATDTLFYTSDGGFKFSTGEAAAAAQLKLSDGSANYITIVPPSISGDYTLTLPTAVATADNYALTATGNNATLDWTLMPVNIADVTNGCTITGSGAAILNLSDGTDTHIIKAVRETGLGGRLTIGLDITDYTMVLTGADVIDNDLGLASEAAPVLKITNAAGDGITEYWHAKIECPSRVTFNNRGITFNATNDINVDDAYLMSSASGRELSEADGEQAWLMLDGKVNQTSTGAYQGLRVDMLETGVGDGSTNTRLSANALLELDINSVPVFNVCREVTTEDRATSTLLDATATTDSKTIWTQPANSILLSAKMVLTEQFAATSLTDMDITLGTAGDNDGIIEGAMNLTSDAANTAYSTRGTLWDEAAAVGFLYKDSATAWIAYATATGANLNTLTAGTIKFYFTYMKC